MALFWKEFVEDVYVFFNLDWQLIWKVNKFTNIEILSNVSKTSAAQLGLR